MADSAPRLRWQLDWKSLLAIVLMLPVLLSLGFWQLERAAEKQRLLDAAEQRRGLSPVDVSSLEEYPNYRPVFAEGRFDSQRYWLLDNRIRQGRFGYEIIALLKLTDGRHLLVERGWIAADPSRQTLPKVDFPEGIQRVEGELYRSLETPYSLGEIDQREWPRRRQWFDYDRAAEDVDSLLPTILRLSEHSPGALRTDRLLINVSPQKHRGYAVQWFAMAAVLGVIFIIRNSNILTRRKPSAEESKR